jgi:hypothetical protein
MLDVPSDASFSRILPLSAFETTQEAKMENKTNGAPACSRAFFLLDEDEEGEDFDEDDDVAAGDDTNVRFCTTSFRPAACVIDLF